MKRVLLIASSFDGAGGGPCVAAWALQALYADFDVTVLTWKEPDFGMMNRRFGTSVPAGGARAVCISRLLRWLVDAMPLRLALLRRALLESAARRLVQLSSFDVVASADNEMSVGPRMVQYIHFPWALYPRPGYDLRWYHPGPLVRLYRTLISRGLGYSREAVKQNLTLVNSAWTGRHYTAWYDAPSQVLYPPAPVEAEPSDWSERRNAFICLGRFAPEKRIPEIIAILRAVRNSGFDVTLDICGQIDDPAYYRLIRAEVEAAGDWVRLHVDLPRPAMMHLVSSCRFGIHGMIGEHFGIAVAEMIRLGCLCFASSEGGPAEILGDPRLLFSSDAEAVERIRAVLSSPDLQTELRGVIYDRAARFSPEAFMAGFRTACEKLET